MEDRRVQSSALQIALMILSLAIFCQAIIQHDDGKITIREQDELAVISFSSPNASNDTNLTMSVVTLDDYLEQLQGADPDCNTTLVELDLDLPYEDPAENDDIHIGKYFLSYDVNSTSFLLTLTVNDDNVAESEEVFILYMPQRDFFSDRCAFPVWILDNDRLYFNFSVSEVLATEGGAISNISIMKNGMNEHNVSFRIALNQSSDETMLMIQETDYIFTPSTAKLSVHFTISDNHIYGNLGVFRVCLLDIIETYDSDTVFNGTFPECVSVRVQDNDVARVGFLNDSTIVLKEGQMSAKICVGFKHPVDRDANISIPIKLSSANNLPDTGHDLYMTKPSIILDAKNFYECFEVYTEYDTNIKGSDYNISLTIQESLIPMVIIEEGLLEVAVLDSVGIAFESEPKNVTVGIGEDAFFPCTYNGLTIIPYWNISSTREWRIVPTNRLPPKHYYNGTGLIVWDIDPSHNMTSYSCVFQLFNRDSLKAISSSVGTLLIPEDISFHLTFNELADTKSIDIIEGGPIQTLTISKSGHSLDTYLILLAILKDYEGYCGFGYVDIEWYIFGRDRSSYSLLLSPLINETKDDSTPEGLKVFYIKLATADVIQGENKARVNTDEPVVISLYDNDVSVGFTNLTITIAEQSVGKVCMKAYNEIHPNVSVSIDLLEDGDFPTGLNISSRNIQFKNSNSEVCISLTFVNQECDENKNFVIHIINNSLPESFTIFLHQPNITVYTNDTSGDCLTNNSNNKMLLYISTGSVGSVIIILIILITLLANVIAASIINKKRRTNVVLP